MQAEQNDFDRLVPIDLVANHILKKKTHRAEKKEQRDFNLKFHLNY